MTTANVELTFDQLLAAVRKLPTAQKTRLWQTLDAEPNREDINREFDLPLEEIWAANEEVSEDQVMADVNAAVQQVRAEHRACS